ncbi:MAG TPA: hypothetical protein VFD82_05975 [Planctomycetota bacterium]|nr:hypothetical protein [Planctomycetota bacterium]
MRKLALALVLLPLAACSTFGWENSGQTVTAEQQKRGVKDVATLANKYETESWFRSVRRRSDGRNNAFGRDLMNLSDFIDRHFWNYNVNDPYINYPSNTTKLEHLGRFGLVTLSGIPPIDEFTTR